MDLGFRRGCLEGQRDVVSRLIMGITGYFSDRKLWTATVRKNGAPRDCAQKWTAHGTSKDLYHYISLCVNPLLE